MDNIVNLESVDRYNSMYGLETLHPLVSVVDLTKATKIVNHTQMNYGVYALFLKQTKSCDLKYGRRSYDYQEGTIVCFAPGQAVRVDMIEDEITPEVYGIVFHPDLIRGTSLGKSIKNYTFFSYAVNEALHLSDQEKGIVMDCLKKISIELEHAIDKHSKALIAMNIELLLNYCMRFYERQFITRSDANKDALTKFEQLLNEYFLSKLPMQEGLPSVKYFADKICLSSNYFGDMVKKETGKTPQEHIQDKVIEMAKEHITETDETVSQIAYTLGFQYPQHLCRLFKKRVGCTPNEYRTQQGQII
ncbi:helix-turn-helix transcriptional regulator [Bacteroides nordii]|uniref:helix-turn-helix domain-containing protein n=1 Tax=Bacteroides TaxID=816 RepID=UPI0004704E69|nr:MULTISPECIES: helix-turn-helix transcriptional regulator [Bacteroides]UAK44256.1 helix-turn-helix transcriptional regulator [Bacteroides nordii]